MRDLEEMAALLPPLAALVLYVSKGSGWQDVDHIEELATLCDLLGEHGHVARPALMGDVEWLRDCVEDLAS